jgi:hypothetical protein
MSDEKAVGLWRDGRTPARVCSARRTNGEPCKRPPIEGANVCRTHGGGAPQVKAAAKVRLEMAANRMAQELLGIAIDDNAPPAVKLAAIKDALDRAGLAPNARVDVTHEVKPYEHLLERVLRGPREADPNIIDAEVVNEGEGRGSACKSCGVDFSAYTPPAGGYPALCRRCRQQTEQDPRPSPSEADEEPVTATGVPRPRRAPRSASRTVDGPAGTPGGLVSAEDAVAEAAVGQARARPKKKRA